MSRTKYLTFGLRADRNLSDLTNPTEALDNILNDISTELDADGNPLQFSSADLLPLVGIAETNLANQVNDAGQSTQLINLGGSTVQASLTDNTLVDVEPRITIQDYIDNARVVLGDPPWTQGGTGPDATFIPSDRLNANTTDVLNSEIKANTITPGNRYRLEGNLVNETQMNAISVTNKGSPPAVGDIFVALDPLPSDMSAYSSMDVRNVTIPTGQSGTSNANALKAGEVFTTKVDTSLASTVGPVKFWTDGKFKITGRLHPSFTDNYGGVQWVGYLSGKYAQRWFNTGFYIIEEDLVDDGSNNNWNLVKAVTSENTKTFYNIKWADEGDVTRIEFTNEEDYKRVAEEMKITLNGNLATVDTLDRIYDISTGAYKFYATLDINVGNTDSSGSIQTFEHDLVNDQLDSGTFYFTNPTGNDRRRVRYTAYWPTLSQNQRYSIKEFDQDLEGSRVLSFYYFYTNDGSTDSFGKYTFPYFRDNRLHTLKQDSTAKLSVSDTISIEYAPKQRTADVLAQPYSDTGNTISEKSVKLDDNGTLVSDNLTDNVFETASTGDWIITVPGFNTDWTNAASKAYAFQITEKVDADKAYVSTNYGTLTGLALNVKHDIILVKNKGLVGIYKRDARSLPLVSKLRKLDTGTGAMNKSVSIISDSNLIHNITFTGGAGAGTSASHDHPLRISTSTVDSGDATITDIIAVAHPNNSSDADSATLLSALGISLVYASKGLSDLSAASECAGVYGLEVSHNSAPSSPQKIYVTDISRGNAMASDVVYYKGSTSGTPIIDEATDIANGTNASLVTGHGTDGTGSFIEISRQIQSTIPAGATIVLVPDGYGAPERNKNREYCVIPLNTAPPFESTDLGLATPSGHPNLIVEHLVYKNLAVDVPTANLKSFSQYQFGSNNANNTPNKYLNLKAPNDQGVTTTYKVLINDNTLTTI